MSKNYFAIERDGQCWNPVILADKNRNPAFEDFLDMSYEEMKSSKRLEDFVNASMEAADRICDAEDDQTIVTLVGSDNVFIWSIIMGYFNDDIRYCLMDWKKDGHSYRYEP
jgi:hypothetical protein